MKTHQEVFALTSPVWKNDFREIFAMDYHGDSLSRNQNRLLAWKILLVGIMVLFSLTLFPAQSAVETGMSADSILQIINRDRGNMGLAPLRQSYKLEMAARDKAEHILQNGYFAHISPSGVKPWDFIKKADFDYSYAGENLAINYTNVYELEKQLLESPSHRANLLSDLFTQAGIAVVAGEFQGQRAVITVQMFASPADVLANN